MQDYSCVPSDFLNHDMFDQLLELDRDDPGFLREIVKTYLNQATSSLKLLEDNLDSKNILEISKVGHLLKGSSAALGLSLLAGTCERIQYLGKINCSDDITAHLLDKLKTEIQLANLQFQMAKEFFMKLK